MIVYYDVLEQLEDFNNEQIGQIFKAMIKYDKDGELPTFEGEMKVAFRFIKLSLDKNKEEYLLKCEQNRENVLKRWNKQDTNVYNRIQSNNSYTNATDNDNDNETDIDLKEKKKNNKKKSVGFTPPTLSEIQAYVDAKNYNVDVEKFLDYYTTSNWKDRNGKQVKNWKLKLIVWNTDRTHSNQQKNARPVIDEGNGVFKI